MFCWFSIYSFRLEHTIGKQGPGTSDDRAKSTVLARMQRVEGSIHDMGQTMDHMFILLKHVDEKLDRLSSNNTNRPLRTIGSPMNVKFHSVPEEIP